MNEQIVMIAERICGLREIVGISIQEMATLCDMELEEYLNHEEGKRDFSFTFLYKVAGKLGVDITEILTGDMPRLSQYSLIRAGDGLPIQRRKGFDYLHLAYLFKNKAAEPFYVTAKFEVALADAPIVLSSHDGQEFNYILDGSLKVKIEDHEMILNAGDTLYYDAKHRHGMVAIDGCDCHFLAVVIKTH